MLVEWSQYGYGIPGGAEALVSEVRCTIAVVQDPLAAALDVKNAFGNARRQAVLRQLFKALPVVA
eukprot:10496880-Lingulodinium_polyedra.AAC.1